MSVELFIGVGVTVVIAALAAAVSFGAMRGSFLTEISNIKEMLTSMKKENEEKISDVRDKLDELDAKHDSAEGWRKAHDAVHAVYADRDRMMTPAFGRKG
jgi:hypothetical protein